MAHVAQQLNALLEAWDGDARLFLSPASGGDIELAPASGGVHCLCFDVITQKAVLRSGGVTVAESPSVEVQVFVATPSSS